MKSHQVSDEPKLLVPAEGDLITVEVGGKLYTMQVTAIDVSAGAMTLYGKTVS